MIGNSEVVIQILQSLKTSRQNSNFEQRLQFQMEALYWKLHNKYTELKKEKESPFVELNRELELKFMNYKAATDEMIGNLKSENVKFRGQVDDLKSELAATRSSSNEQHIQCQKLLMEENQKTKELSEEISKLRKLEPQECSTCAAHQEIESEERTSHQDSPARGVPRKSVLRSAKKRKPVDITEGSANAHVDGEHGRPTDYIRQPACCQIKINSPGGDATDCNVVYCMFQCLAELVLGMKFSPHSQSSKPCIQALHQSSGYSFTLTWVTNTRGETELLYRVLSLGTFEKAAPEWMREMLMFSTSMCRIFFERLSRVFKC